MSQFPSLAATAIWVIAEAMATQRSQIPVSLVVVPRPRDASDTDLARALVAGSSWAIAETWRRFAPGVIMLGRRALGSESEAEDLAQEVFQRVFAKARTLRSPDRFRSFVFSFAIRLLRTELRRRKARSWLSFHRPETLVDLGAAPTEMETRDLLRRFYALLDRLAPRHRLVFVLRHLESMTVEEVAAQMELSISTVKRLLSRATDKLSRWVEADPDLLGFIDRKEWRP
jgi:RNA polymerase sigma-70 factor (ECF subfamily)